MNRKAFQHHDFCFSMFSKIKMKYLKIEWVHIMSFVWWGSHIIIEQNVNVFSWFRNQTLSYLTMITSVVIENETIHKKNQHNKDEAFSRCPQGQACMSWSVQTLVSNRGLKPTCCSRRDSFQCKSKYGCKDQESKQSSTTPAPGYQWESNKLTVRHHKREPRGQPCMQQVTTRHK